MTGLEWVSFTLGAIIMATGINETTKQALGDDMAHLSIWRWMAVYLLAVSPFVAVGAPLVWLGSLAVSR